MQKELYERIGILEDNEIISGKVADYARKIVDYILSRCSGVPQDKMEMFITHLAMAGKRAEERTEENPIDEGIFCRYIYAVFVIKKVGNMRIVVGGQIDKEEIAELVKKQLGDEAEVTVRYDYRWRYGSVLLSD